MPNESGSASSIDERFAGFALVAKSLTWIGASAGALTLCCTVFGFVVTLMGCYHGYQSRGGAAGVGQATTYAVVSASILILLLDYVLTAIFFAK